MSTVNAPQPSPSFYTAGGTMDPMASSYIERKADKDLLEAVMAGQFCYILTSRQTGKSSLMMRTAIKLQENGIKSAIIDLTDRSTSGATIEQWYLEQVQEIAEQLGLDEDPFSWWEKESKLSVVRRFSAFFTQVVLKDIAQPLVIFVDEIDSTLSLPFNCDDYFAVIRSLYNKRATNPALKRLTFVLLGVASPSDLIKDERRTPFNIGMRVQLNDFTQEEAQPLRSGLAPDEQSAEKILEDILFFTGGHPYLTQITCLHVAQWAKTQWNKAGALDIVQRKVDELFLKEAGKVSDDDNLQFVQKRILSSKIKKQLLETYRGILRGKVLPDNELDPILMELKLSGLIKVDDGIATVRNTIYKRVFNDQWISKNILPPSPDRTRMLQRLHLRYRQMLSQSLQGAILMELGLASRPDAVYKATSFSLHLSNLPEQLLPAGTTITEVYEQAQQELLILGEPGAGKSTLLLQLAYHLAELAQQDTTQPLPVLVPLSSWATKRFALEDWLIEQCELLYDVPHDLIQQWVRAGVVIFLLDGLDEMEEAARPACIAAINVYHRDNLQPLVVCSRTNEYKQATSRGQLALHTAVVIQPLSEEQVDTYLAMLGTPVAALRKALKINPTLAALATTPLILQTLILTYQGTTVRQLYQTETALQQTIWKTYVERMIARKGDSEHYPLDHTITWLSWLARLMRGRNQTIFYLEGLQPDVLPQKYYILHKWSIRLFVGLVAGCLFGLLAGLVAGWLVGLTVGLVAGWLVGLTAGLFSEVISGREGEQLTRRELLTPNEGIQRSLKRGLSLCLIIGLLAGIAVGLISGLIRGLAFGLEVGLISGLLAGLIGGLSGGLATALEHYTLRFWLWQLGLFPWNAVSFLENATARNLLQRVGGGYSFIHRLLLDYFADIE